MRSEEKIAEIFEDLFEYCKNSPYQIERVVLHGDYAFGIQNESSIFEILVFVDSLEKINFLKRLFLILDVESLCGELSSCLLYPSSLFKNPTSNIKKLLSSSKLIYQREP